MEDIFLLLLTLAVLPFKKPSFKIYIKKKSFVTLNLKYIPVGKHIFWPNQQVFVKKSWNDRKYIFHKREKNINKHFSEKEKKCFCVFGEAHGRPRITLNFFLAKRFIIFCHIYEYTFVIISRLFSPKNCWYYLAMCFLIKIHFKLSVTKDFFM